jgi:rubrerythrin
MTGLRIDEVLQMAMQAEETGIAFYELASRQCGNLFATALFKELSEQEQEHLQAFAGMREAMADPARTRRLELEDMAILESVLDDTVLPCQEECRRLATEGNLKKILARAIKMEKDAVALYTRLLPGVDNAQALCLIIEEEKRHIEQLRELRQAVDKVRPA